MEKTTNSNNSITSFAKFKLTATAAKTVKGGTETSTSDDFIGVEDVIND